MLKLMRNVLLVVILIALVWFAVLNPSQRVEVDLWMLGKWVDVPLVIALFLAFAIGAVVGTSMLVFNVMDLHAKLRHQKRHGQHLEGELTSLRNLPLEDETSEVSPGSAS